MRIDSRTTALLASLVLGGALGLTACGGPTDPPSAAPKVTVTGDATPVPPADDCAGIGDRVKEHLDSAEVRSVVVQGQCTTVVVATTLGDTDDVAAQRLCDTAAEVAYSDDVNSVSVLAASGTELAIGISGAKCLA